MNLLFPGRHHLLTNFQYDYLQKVLKEENIENIIFAVTSANHSNTRRNPLPLFQRAMALQEFSADFRVPSFVYDVDDVGMLENFASYTIKRIESRSNNRFRISPQNTLVLCSTPVLELYEKLGYRILPAELDRSTGKYNAALPWEIVEEIANSSDDLAKIPVFSGKVHPASQRLWKTYNLGDVVRMLFKDVMIGNEGELTETRDFNMYVRQMDGVAELKFKDTLPYIKPGRIGDIGCAIGSWIKLAGGNERLRESDFYGVEVSRHLHEICEQRKNNKEFPNPYVFFSKKNAVTGLVFTESSMNTIHTSSLTHEIESYGSRNDLLKFIENRYNELTNRGVWINRDVIAPEDKDSIIHMKLSTEDGRNDDYEQKFSDRKELNEYLSGLSTYARFLRFAQDFRHEEGYNMNYDVENVDGANYLKLKMGDACEYMTKKDYTDNWQSEMHEAFCFWSFSDWKNALESAGFKILPESRAFTNNWIVENRLKNRIELYKKIGSYLVKLNYPVTHAIIVSEKP